MTSIYVKLKPSAASGKAGSIYYRIVHERKIRIIPTGYNVFPREWNSDRSAIACSPHSDRRAVLLSIEKDIRHDTERLKRIIGRLEGDASPYTVDDVANEFERYRRDYTLFSYLQASIVSLKSRNRLRTAETYRSTLNSFRRFRDGNDIMLDALTAETVEAYEAYLKRRGNTPNTTSFYMRILRAVYNRAVEEEIIDNRKPFRHVYTGVEKTVKRAVPLSTISRIKSLDLSAEPHSDYARDMFMMSFFLRGMSFVDMAFLRKSDMQCGHITYRRRKTGQKLSILWTADMQEILDKYPANASPYLLPIIRHTGINERVAYRNAAYIINYHLKKVGAIAGATIPLTMYCARHSWASAAKAKGIPLSIISEGMGHDSETTTRIYLASLDASTVDDANELIIRSL